MERKGLKKDEVSLDAMDRLASVMNDTPSLVKLGKIGFNITALKPGTQWLIAQEACRIQKAENANFSDVIKQFAENIPSVVHVLTLAILNDKDAIFKDYKSKEYSDRYNEVYETIMWETDPKHWMGVFVEIMDLLSMDYFFESTNAIAVIREMALGKKRKMTERQKS